MAITEEQEAEFSRAAGLDDKELVKVEGTKMKLSKELLSQYVCFVGRLSLSQIFAYFIAANSTGCLLSRSAQNLKKRALTLFPKAMAESKRQRPAKTGDYLYKWRGAPPSRPHVYAVQHL